MDSNAQGRDLASIFGDVGQNESLSEIKLPLRILTNKKAKRPPIILATYDHNYLKYLNMQKQKVGNHIQWTPI